MDYFNLHYKPSVFNNFQALSGYESLYSHQSFLNYCPEVLWKRSFANFKFIGISIHKIPYFYIFIVIERLYLTLQNGMCISSSLFLKSIINKIYCKSFKCQCNIFALGLLVSFFCILQCLRTESSYLISHSSSGFEFCNAKFDSYHQYRCFRYASNFGFGNEYLDFFPPHFHGFITGSLPGLTKKA